MSQLQIGQLLGEHTEAIHRHRRYILAHEAILGILHDLDRQTITTAQAISQLEEAATALDELGLVALYRQTIERLHLGQRGTT